MSIALEQKELTIPMENVLYDVIVGAGNKEGDDEKDVKDAVWAHADAAERSGRQVRILIISWH
jgi:hypothetical protein